MIIKICQHVGFVFRLRVFLDDKFPALIKMVCVTLGRAACDVVLQLQQYTCCFVHERFLANSQEAPTRAHLDDCRFGAVNQSLRHPTVIWPFNFSHEYFRDKPFL